MLELGDDGARERLAAEEAAEGQLVVVGVGELEVLLGLLVAALLPLALQLPALLVVGAVVHELAVVCTLSSDS